MELMTCCPACGTTFAARLEQLQLRKGYVRCINCAHIFDGYEAVVSAPASPHTPPPLTEIKAKPVYEPQPDATVHRKVETASPEPFVGSREPADDANPFGPNVEPGLHRTDSDPEPGYTWEEDEADAADSPIYGESRVGGRPAVPGFLAGDARPARRSGLARLAWAVLILAGLLLAAAQAVYIYRMQIAVQWPALRPVLEAACQRFQCEVPYARKLKLLSVSDSSLQRKGQNMVFEALLRNSLDGPQQWPVLWLELTDVSGAVLSRRYLPPDVYLGASPRPGPAFPAASERRISVVLEIKAEHVSGYQVGLFFP
ncbi:DUF3426 domain-containing protein [Pusillimonas sp. CC-YST705]|uniref:DUF3426 domain-containing protein n=1 Tax=Mesopusillimonas faecipullorum TaxID=2755040 RepID=A0ABS8C9B6_9BURK|nr:zinc-ribbon and DUF3426 domain-containing protein [Mesopusillimonas faecipullorum]MCB5362631.1 DUF3426 domain-containing protein [Mesopusillimonas faecipullorum]